MTTVVMAGGGTAGHVHPGLCVARLLQEAGHTVYWLGTSTGMEAKLVKPVVPFKTIYAFPLRGKQLWAKLKSLIGLPWSVLHAGYWLLRYRPDHVLVTGGYVALPVGIAAWLLRRALLVHEQNAVLGLTNRVLAHLTTQRFSAYPLSGWTCIGQPTYFHQDRTCPAKRHVLVLGGSRGAQAINEWVAQTWHRMPEKERPILWHQVGVAHRDAWAAWYASHQIEARVDGFIDDMEEAYAFASLVISRAGALTLAELAHAKLPAILVPYPYAVDDHQTGNAKAWLADHEGYLWPQDRCHAQDLHAWFESLVWPTVTRHVRKGPSEAAQALVRRLSLP